MQPNSKTIFAACSVALMLASTSTPAVTLGRLRGSVLLGKELDVSVNVQFAAEEDGSATCFDADVNYGETPLERSRITIHTQPGPQANSQIVRISSPAKVNEAVVSVILKAACGPKAARRYVLLSDVLSETLGSDAPAVSPNMPAVDRSQSAIALPAAPVPATAPVSTPAKATPAPVAKKAPTGARLKLAPLANVSATDVAAPVAKSVNSAAIDELQRRVEVIEKARDGNPSAEQLLQNAARAKALEADIESLRIATAKNQKNLQTMMVALEGKPTQDYGRNLIYLLGVLLAACLAALAYIFLRLRNGGFDVAPWWSGGEDRLAAAAKATAPAPVAPASGVPTSPVHLAEPSTIALATGAGPATVQSQPVGLDTETTRSTVAMDVRPVQPVVDAMTAISPRGSHLEFAPSGTIKAINTKEMLDVRQQVEFFMALGQHDDAVRLLETNIRESLDANPLVFLDLLRILHTLSRRDDFERYREEFNLQFTGRILDYAHFLSEGNGLDAYEDICQQIVVLWPTEYTIDFIEQCLVRTPEDDPEQGIDLEAFKDLLLLYGVLKRLEQADESAYLPFSTSRTANSTPVAFSGGFVAEKADAGSSPPLPVIDPDSQPADIDLDIDLDVDLDIDLDVGVDAAKADKKPNNLIDFDMSGYVKPSPGKPPKS